MGEVRSEILQRWGRFSQKGQLQPGGKGRPTFSLEKEGLCCRLLVSILWPAPDPGPDQEVVPHVAGGPSNAIYLRPGP